MQFKQYIQYPYKYADPYKNTQGLLNVNISNAHIQTIMQIGFTAHAFVA